MMSRSKTLRLDVLKIEVLEQELERVRSRNRSLQLIKSTVSVIIVVAAAAVLLATMVFPVLRIYGTSMTPTLNEGDIVVSVKGTNLKRGDVIVFYYNNKILCKRLIGKPGDWIDIDKNGNVSVNNVQLDEPYLPEKALGDCNIELPYQVPENRYFVMGDHRSVSVDSRNTQIGCISEEQIVGRIIFSILPFHSINK